MNTDMWQKACAFLLVLLLSLAGWGLWEVHALGITCERIETKMTIWHAPMGGAVGTHGDEIITGIMLTGGRYDPQMQIEFAQRAMVTTYNAIKRKQYDTALKTLLVGLEETGLTCREHKDGLNCER